MSNYKSLLSMAMSGDIVELSTGEQVKIIKKKIRTEIVNGKKTRYHQIEGESGRQRIVPSVIFDNSDILIGDKKVMRRNFSKNWMLMEDGTRMKKKDWLARNVTFDKDFLVVGEVYHDKYTAEGFSEVVDMEGGRHKMSKAELKVFKKYDIFNRPKIEVNSRKTFQGRYVYMSSKNRPKRIGGKWLLRLLYELFIGEIPEGKFVGLIEAHEGAIINNIMIKGDGIYKAYKGYSVKANGKFYGIHKTKRDAEAVEDEIEN